MASPDERILEFCREVYSDHRDRYGRSQQVALGLLAFNGILIGFLATAIWQISGGPSGQPSGSAWLMGGGLVLAAAAAALHIFVATRVKVAWPDPLLLCEKFRDHPAVGEALFLAEILAQATSENQPLVDRKFQVIAVANIITGLAFIVTLVALLLLVV